MHELQVRNYLKKKNHLLCESCHENMFSKVDHFVQKNFNF